MAHLVHRNGCIDASTIHRLTLLIQSPDRRAHALHEQLHFSAGACGMDRSHIPPHAKPCRLT